MSMTKGTKLYSNKFIPILEILENENVMEDFYTKMGYCGLLKDKKPIPKLRILHTYIPESGFENWAIYTIRELIGTINVLNERLKEVETKLEIESEWKGELE